MCARRGLQPRSLSHVGHRLRSRLPPRTRILSIREAAWKGAGCDVIRAEKRSGDYGGPRGIPPRFCAALVSRIRPGYAYFAH